MNDSILNSTKKALGLSADYDVFDPDLIMHINGVFSTLNQIGVGPSNGFMISDEYDDWSTFSVSPVMLNMVKPYIYLRVRMLFDPPGTSFLMNSFEQQIKESEWRLREFAESQDLVVIPDPDLTPSDGSEPDFSDVDGGEVLA